MNCHESNKVSIIKRGRIFRFNSILLWLTNFLNCSSFGVSIFRLEKAAAGIGLCENSDKADDVDDPALRAKAQSQLESLLRSLKQATNCLGFHVNLGKPRFMCFNQDSVISSLKKPLKLVDRFIYIGSNISSTENGVNICIAKVWTDIKWLYIIWKSDHPD